LNKNFQDRHLKLEIRCLFCYAEGVKLEDHPKYDETNPLDRAAAKAWVLDWERTNPKGSAPDFVKMDPWIQDGWRKYIKKIIDTYQEKI